MSDFTAAQIQEFLSPTAFSRLRNQNELIQPEKGVDPYGESDLVTKNAQESITLLRSAFSRVETILSNLATAKRFAEDAAVSSDSEFRDEQLAKLRSLMSGIDVVVDQSRFSGERVLDGSDIILSGATGQNVGNFELQNFMTFAEDGLGLTRLVKDAIVSSFVSPEADMLNKANAVKGLSVLPATFSDPASAGDELEQGNYRFRITYEGANSTVELTNTFLEPIKTITGVDLSGDGIESVDFGNGITLNLGKSTLSSDPGIDKYDFANLGTAHYYGDIIYDPIYRNELFVKDGAAIALGAQVTDTDTVSPATGGALSFNNAAVDNSNDELKEGNYTVSVNYFGTNSTATLRDSEGRLVDLQSNLDLSNPTETIDFENGLSVDFANTGVGTQVEQLSASITVSQSAVGGGAAGLSDPSFTNVIDAEKVGGNLSMSSLINGTLAPGEERLEDGDYNLEVRYLGEFSNVIMRNSDGNIVYTQSNIDLSAQGTTTVQLGNGLDFDFENNNYGPLEIATVSGDVTIEKGLDTPANPLTNFDAVAKELDNDPAVDLQTGLEAKVTDIATQSVPQANELEEGEYTAQLTYLGQNSMVKLFNSEGQMIKFTSNVDLTQVGVDLNVNFNNGAILTVRNDGLDDFGATSEFKFSYAPEKRGTSSSFDFESYISDIDRAIDVVKGQVTLLDETFVSINRVAVTQEIARDIARSNNPGLGAITLIRGIVNDRAANVFRPQASNPQAMFNIKQIIARAGTANPVRVNDGSLLNSASSIDPNSVMGVLASRASASAAAASSFQSSNPDPSFDSGDDDDS